VLLYDTSEKEIAVHVDWTVEKLFELWFLNWILHSVCAM